MKRILLFLNALALAAGTCLAQQEAKQEITVQGSSFLGKNTTGTGIQNEPTNSGGLMAGYRFSINKWLAAEGDYDFTSNSQKYVTPTGNFRSQVHVHGITGAGVVKLPTFWNVKPFVLAGGGAIVFDPRNNAALEQQARGALVYGGGADLQLVKHLKARAEYRGFVYKAPDFGLAQLNADSYTHAAVPSAGLVFTF